MKRGCLEAEREHPPIPVDKGNPASLELRLQFNGLFHPRHQEGHREEVRDLKSALPNHSATHNTVHRIAFQDTTGNTTHCTSQGCRKTTRALLYHNYDENVLNYKDQSPINPLGAWILRLPSSPESSVLHSTLNPVRPHLPPFSPLKTGPSADLSTRQRFLGLWAGRFMMVKSSAYTVTSLQIWLLVEKSQCSPGSEYSHRKGIKNMPRSPRSCRILTEDECLWPRS